MDLPPGIPEERRLSDVEELPEEHLASAHVSVEELLARSDVDALSEVSFQSAIDSQSRAPRGDDEDLGRDAVARRDSSWQETAV